MSHLLGVAATPNSRSWAQEDDQRNRWQALPWVPWGVDKDWGNLYPDKIESLFVRSSILNRVATDNADGIVGQGLVFEGPDAALADQLFAAAGIDLEFLTRCAQDISLFNGFTCQVTMANDPERGVIPARFRHQKIARVRVERPGKSPEPTAYYISPDWKGVNKSDGTPVYGYEERNPTAPVAGQEPIPFVSAKPVRVLGYGVRLREKVQLYYGFLYSPATDFYPLPDAECCYDALAAYIEIVEYQRRYVANNMSLGGILEVPFSPAATNAGQAYTDEDLAAQKLIQAEYTSKLTGSMNAGKTAIVFLDRRVTGPDGASEGIRFVQPIQDNNDKKFLEVLKSVGQTCLVGLRVVAGELYGLQSLGGFTSQSEHLLAAYELTEKKVIAPKREVLLRFLNRIAADMGLDVLVALKPAPPVSRLLTQDMVAAGVVTVDELRQAIGLEPLQSTVAE
jgi:hypothetical protein